MDLRSLHTPTMIRDEIPAPREYIEIQYKGPNPLKVYKSLDFFLRKIWEIKGTQLYEPDFRWDTTTDPRPFFIHMFAEKGVEKFSKYRVDIKMQGSQPTDPTKSGVLRVEIHGWLKTDFSGFLEGKPLNKALWPIIYYPYMKGYYNARRRKYLEWHRRRIERLAQEIRTMLNIPATPIP